MVEYIQHMGDDLIVANSARISFNRLSKSFTEKDAKLIKFLAENEHTTPFRHTAITLRIKCPIFIARQWHKHQVGMSVNEISGRYIELEEVWTPSEFRKASPTAKQGSLSEAFCGSDHTEILEIYQNALEAVLSSYRALLRKGVCKEQARALLPLGTYTEFYMTGSLQAWVHFYNKRAALDAQQEIREEALKVKEIIEPLFPCSWRALAHVV